MTRFRTKEARTLYKAACLIDTPEKWIKGTYANSGSYCAVGAYHAVSGAGEYQHASTEREFKNVLGCDDGVVEFNDAPDTTHGDGMTLFALAIVLAEDGVSA